MKEDAGERPAAVIEETFGIRTSDAFRWLEGESPEARAWEEKQSARTNGLLAGVAGYSDLQSKIRNLMTEVETVDGLVRSGQSIFFLKLTPPDLTKKLIVLSHDGHSRVLVSVEEPSGGHSRSIDFFVPSHGGRYVAYGVAASGSEDTSVRIVEVATGRVLPDVLPRQRMDRLSWLPSGDSLVYLRKQPPSPNAAAVDKLRNSRVALHKLGTDPALDTEVFGPGISPDADIGPNDTSWLLTSPNAPFVIGVVTRGVAREQALYVKALKDVAAPEKPWKKLADYDMGVLGTIVADQTVYVRRHPMLGNGEIATLRPQDGSHARFATLTPSGPHVLQDFVIAKDAAYITYLDEGSNGLLRVPKHGPATTVPLPFAGSISSLAAVPTLSGASFELEGWTNPADWMLVDSTGASKSLAVSTRPNIDMSDIEVKRVKAIARDQTEVPITIIRRNVAGSHGPGITWLTAYGAYGTSLMPYFKASRKAWLDYGGTIAVAHVRGGGEKGLGWHEAGKLQNRHYSIEDLIDCADFLVREGYTSPSKLGVFGASAGGIVVGGAVNRRPELFGAAVVNVGTLNLLRNMAVGSVGPVNVREFGDPSTNDGYKMLVENDAYLNLHRAPYPAVLVSTGRNDPRVPPWQSSKFVAQLQEASTSGRPALFRMTETGHAMGATSEQQIKYETDVAAFFLWQLGHPDFQER